MIAFHSSDIESFIFAHPVYLQEIQFKFAYECRVVKVLLLGWSCLRLESILVVIIIILISLLLLLTCYVTERLLCLLRCHLLVWKYYHVLLIAWEDTSSRVSHQVVTVVVARVICLKFWMSDVPIFRQKNCSISIQTHRRE